MSKRLNAKLADKFLRDETKREQQHRAKALQDAAPDLLAACELFTQAERDWQTDGGGKMEMTFGEWCDHHKVGAAIASAIAKAKGGAQ